MTLCIVSKEKVLKTIFKNKNKKNIIDRFFYDLKIISTDCQCLIFLFVLFAQFNKTK